MIDKMIGKFNFFERLLAYFFHSFYSKDYICTSLLVFNLLADEIQADKFLSLRAIGTLAYYRIN